MAARSSDLPQQVELNGYESDEKENVDIDPDDPWLGDESDHEIISGGTSFDTIVNICPHPPYVKDMAEIRNENTIFMIAPFKFDPSRPESEPVSLCPQNRHERRGDINHVYMPCSQYNVNKNKKPMWLIIRQSLSALKTMCNSHTATVDDLIRTINICVEHRYEMGSLEHLINDVYSTDERAHFMSTVLSNICTLALNVDTTCVRSPPLLHRGLNRSVTMSQRQAASLLACAFFCLFPFRSDQKHGNKFSNYPNSNFNRLYQTGPPKKIEKLKCILNYFRRITEKMPNGVITIRRVVLSANKKIEDVENTLQIDFANKYIGGGVLGSGCVQEEIRFSICPEMLV